MDAAFDADLTVARLAKISGMSQAHFARAFKMAFSLPPHRYLLTRRIERAAALLRDTDMPVIEIALATGWSSLGTFGRIFRDITGSSPSDCRHSARNVSHHLNAVPHCFIAAAHRPNLKTAVLEKRRRGAHAKLNGIKRRTSDD